MEEKSISADERRTSETALNEVVAERIILEDYVRAYDREVSRPSPMTHQQSTSVRDARVSNVIPLSDIAPASPVTPLPKRQKPESRSITLGDFFAKRLDLWDDVIKTLGSRDVWKSVAVKLFSKGVTKLSTEFVELIESAAQRNGVEQAKRFMEDIRELVISMSLFLEALVEVGLEELAMRLQEQQEDAELSLVGFSTVFISFDSFNETSFLLVLSSQLKLEKTLLLARKTHGKFTIVSLEVSSKVAMSLKRLVEENRFLSEGAINVACCPGRVSSLSNEVVERLTVARQPLNLFGSPITRPRVYLERPELQRLVIMLLRNNFCALQGLGGIGKTTLANEVVCDPRVCRSFSKIHWTTLGSDFRTNEERIMKISSIVTSIDENLTGKCPLTNLELARTFLQQQARRLSKKLLIILDDVWSLSEVELLRGVQNVSILITTRSEEVAHAFREVFMHVEGAGDCLLRIPYLDEGQSVRLLLDASKVKEDVEVDTRAKVLRRCGGVPLAIQVTGSMVCRQPPLLSPWSTIAKLQKDFTVGHEVPKSANYHHSLFSALGMSAKELSVDVYNSWQSLTVFPEDKWIPESVIILLWSLEELESQQILDVLCARSLVEKKVERGVPYAMYRLHDVVKSFLQWKSNDSTRGLHLRLIENYKKQMKNADWTTGPLDPGGSSGTSVLAD